MHLLAVLSPFCPLAARAQQNERMRRIGLLMSTAETDPEEAASVAAFVEALAKLDWRDGSNLRIELRWGNGNAPKIGSGRWTAWGHRPERPCREWAQTGDGPQSTVLDRQSCGGRASRWMRTDLNGLDLLQDRDSVARRRCRLVPTHSERLNTSTNLNPLSSISVGRVGK
jgi:hypothetical protein